MRARQLRQHGAGDCAHARAQDERHHSHVGSRVAPAAPTAGARRAHRHGVAFSRSGVHPAGADRPAIRPLDRRRGAKAGLMRLGINGWRLCAPHTGVARYLLNVIRYWTPESTSRFGEITVYTPRPLDRRLVPLPPNIRERVLAPFWPMLVWENLRLGPARGDDVLFLPPYLPPLGPRGAAVGS